MLNLFLIILYALLLISSYRKNEVGIAFLVLLNCTVDMSFLNMSLPGIGTLAGTDFVVLGLLVRLFKYKRKIYSLGSIYVYLVVLFSIVGMIYLYAYDYVGVKYVYNSLFRYVLVWLVYVFVVDYNESQRFVLLRLIYGSVVFVLCFQLYAYVSLDVGFIKRFYYQFRDTGVFDLVGWGAEKQILYQIATMGYPRLYPAGTTLCLTVLSFLSAQFFVCRFEAKKNLCLNLLYVLILLGFLLSLRGRAPLLSFTIIILYLYALPVFTRDRKYSFFSESISSNYLVVTLLWLSLVVLLLLVLSDNIIIGSMIDRIESFDLGFYFDSEKSNRASDGIIALEILSENPIFGIGYPSIPLSHYGLHRAGFDVHPLLSVALYKGLPVLVIILLIIWSFLKKFISVSVCHLANNTLPYGVAIVNLLLLAILNSIQVFSSAMNLIPFLIFLALFNGSVREERGCS